MLNSPLLFNPYHNETFFGFILKWLVQMKSLITGKLAIHQLASDDIQVLVLMGVAFSSALVGSFLVLKKMTMLANSLSHTILIGIVLAYFFAMLAKDSSSHDLHFAPIEWMMMGALIMGLFTTFLTEFLTKVVKLQEDASTGLVFTSLFALGVILVTILTRNAHIGTEAVMGNADSLHYSDIKWAFLVFGLNLFLICLFFKEFTLTTFDPAYAYALGFSPLFFNYLLMAQVSATTIISFRAVGVLLVLAFMTGPVLTARLFVNSMKNLLAAAMCIGALCSLIGVALTRHILTVYGIALSTAGVVVCTLLGIYVIAILLHFMLRNIQAPAFKT